MAPSSETVDEQAYEPTEESNQNSTAGVSEDQKHHNQVQGGIKAAISNPKVSDEKKEELKERLD